jgi:hypothetical protein
MRVTTKLTDQIQNETFGLRAIIKSALEPVIVKWPLPMIALGALTCVLWLTFLAWFSVLLADALVSKL